MSQEAHAARASSIRNGAIIEREGSIHVSNVMKADECGRRSVKRTLSRPNPST
jgi:ribosomal protein L24